VETLTSNLTANDKSVSIKLKNPFEVLTERPRVPSGRPRPNMARTISRYISRLLKIFVESEPIGDAKKNLDVGLTM
jgi:hypothetical protein